MSFKAVLEADIKGFSNNIDKAISDVDRLEKTTLQKLSKVGDSFIGIGKKASILSVALVGVGAKAFSMAADFQDALGATGQIFKDNSDTVQDWANNLDASYGIAKKEALEYSNLMGSMLINIGNLTEEQASKQSAKLIELAGDLTAMYGGTTQEAVRALTGALKGNNTMLDNYGMAVNEALIKQKALELGLISGTSEMSLQARQAATLALIWEQTGAAQGQAAREADGASGAMRAFRTEVANLSTELGEVLLPIITPIITKLADLVGSLRSLSPEMQSMIVGIAGVTAVAGPLLIVIGNILKALPLIKAALVALTGPIGLTVAAIAGAAALIISNWDSIKAYFTTGDGAEMFSIVKEMATELKNGLVGTFNDIKRLVTYVWDAIGSDIVKILKNAFSTIVAVVETLVKTFKNVIQVLDGLFRLDFKTVLDGLKNLFVDIFSGISKIVLNGVSSVSSALAGLFDLIGLDKWASGLRSFSEKLTPAMQSATESTKETTAAIKDQSAAIEDQSASVDKLTSSMKELAKVNVPESIIGGGIVIDKQKKETIFDQLFSEKDGDMVLKPIIEPNIEPKVLKDKMLESVKSAMGDLSDGIQVLTIDLSSMLASSLTDIFGAVSEAIASGDNVMEALGSSLLGTLGGIMVQLGQMVLVTGEAIEAVKAALVTGLGIPAIAAGVALIAIGSLFKAGAKKIGNSMGSGGGGYSSAPSLRNTGPSYGPSDYRGPYQDDFKVEFKIGTNELVGVLNTAEQRRNRI